MINEVQFKGFKALKIDNEHMRLIVIPELGGKIASAINKDKDFELFFQHKNETFSKPNLYDDYSKFDASGFDDCFPTIDACSIKVNGKEIKYPDHGEIWSKTMQYEDMGGMLKMWCESTILPYRYEKCISLNDNMIYIDYKIINTGDESFPCIWTMHGLVNCEEDMDIHLPIGTKQIMNVHNSKILGRPGQLHTYPKTCLVSDQIYQLDRVKCKHANKTEKFYAHGPLSEGVCGAYYPAKNLSYKIHFDKEKLPYLGLWISEGGFRGDYNLALEPSNGYYDNIETAKKNGKLPSLQPGEKMEFTIKIEIVEGKFN